MESEKIRARRQLKHRVAIPAGKWDRYSSGHYRNNHATKSRDLPFLRAGGSFPIVCATLQLLPSEFPGPHNRADLIYEFARGVRHQKNGCKSEDRQPPE